MLRIVKPRYRRKAWHVLQHLRQSVPGKTHKFEQPSGLNIGEGILLQAPKVGTKLKHVTATGPVGIVGQLINIGRAPLRVIDLVAQSGES